MFPTVLTWPFRFGWLLLGEIWVATVLWTAADTRARFLSRGPRAGALTLAVGLPVAGALLYLLVRPRRTWRARRQRRRLLELLEVAAASTPAGEEAGLRAAPSIAPHPPGPLRAAVEAVPRIGGSAGFRVAPSGRRRAAGARPRAFAPAGPRPGAGLRSAGGVPGRERGSGREAARRGSSARSGQRKASGRRRGREG